MADYGIFGQGSSGNSWFANKLDDFHDSTKKYDPISHYAVEWPMKGAHWLVEKGGKGMADMGIAPGFMNRLSSEADENGNNFGLGSQRMGLGIASVLGAMYGAGAMGAGEGAAAGGGGAFGSSGVPWAGGVDAGASGLGYAEAGGGFVGNAGAEGGAGSFFGNGAGAGGSNWMDQLTQMGGQGGGGGQGGQAQQGGTQAPPPNMGNPALTAALAKLVGDQEEAKRQEQQGPFAQALNYQQKPQNESWDEVLRRFSQQYAANNQGSGYAGTY
jgi:hypothetical protein